MVPEAPSLTVLVVVADRITPLPLLLTALPLSVVLVTPLPEALTL